MLLSQNSQTALWNWQNFNFNSKVVDKWLTIYNHRFSSCICSILRESIQQRATFCPDTSETLATMLLSRCSREIRYLSAGMSRWKLETVLCS